jgi:NAD(P)-dependent dehydrogenase (short-subunit alcohol dehydrogenase family)
MARAVPSMAGQVVLLTGAGSGIGKETAHRLVKEGAHLVCVDLNEASAQATAKAITVTAVKTRLSKPPLMTMAKGMIVRIAASTKPVRYDR